MRTVHLMLVPLLLLGACRPIPAQLDFDTDRRIFRGIYEAEVDLRKASDMVALNDDASLLVMGSSSFQASKTQLWDVTDEEPIEGALGDSTDTTGVAITRDGSLAAVGFRGGVSLWEVATNTVRTRLGVTTPECPDCGGGHLAFSPDGTLLAVHSGGGRPEKVVLVFDTTTGKRLLTLTGAAGSVEEAEVRFGPDGTLVALVSQGWEYPAGGERFRYVSRVALWSIPQGELLDNYLLETAGALQVDAHAWNEEGDAPLIGVILSDQLVVRESVSGKVVMALPLEQSVVAPGGDPFPPALFFSPDERFVVLRYNVQGEGGNIIVWDLATAEPIIQRETMLKVLGFTADSRLVTHSKEGVALREPQTLEAQKLLVNGAITPLRIDAEPAFVDAQHYTVGGMATFGDVAPVPITGEVDGGDLQRYRRMSPIMTPYMTLEFEHEGQPWRFESYDGYEGGISWSGYLTPEAGLPVYTITLEPLAGP